MTAEQLIYTRINRKFELYFQPKVQRAIHYRVRQVVNILKTEGVAAAEYFLTTNIGNDRLAPVIRDLYTAVGMRWARTTYSRLLPEARAQKGFGFSFVWTKFIIDYLEKHLLDKITFEINRTTQNAMLRAISRGTAAGWSTDQIVAGFEDWPFERYQAARIVRTEVNRAANVGSTAQAETSEYEQMKEWQSAEDRRVRGSNPKDHADHVALDGVKINADDVFHDPRNNDQLQFPGDPRAKAESVINCRCHASYTFKRDSNGNLIKKRKTTTVIFPGQIRRSQTVTI